MIHDDWEPTMPCYEEAACSVLLPYEKVHTAGTFHEAPATTDLPLADDRLLPNQQDEWTCTDYSEEAIPERDPAYRLPAGTDYGTKTVDYMPAAERRALARCLEELGMS